MCARFFKKNIFIQLILSIISIAGTLHALTPEKPLVIVIASYKNSQWYKKNLDSVFTQKYSNYRVIYIDDCSPDDTGNLVEKYIKKCEQEHRVTLIKNTTRHKALANHYRAVHMCDDDEIVVQLDGDDWFPDNTVLSYLNTVYQDPNVFLTYGQHKNWPSDRHGYCKPLTKQHVEQQKMRDMLRWSPGQLRTFYAWLFKQVRLSDFVFPIEEKDYKGKFYPTNYDLAFFFPMMEMARFNYKFIDKVVYIYNTQSSINDFKVDLSLLRLGGKLIRALPKYQPLKHSMSGYFDRFADAQAQLVITSTDSPSNLVQLLDSVNQYVTGISSIDVIAHASTQEIYDNYVELKNKYPNLTLIMTPSEIASDNTGALLDHCSQSTHEHTLLATDHMLVTEPINISECIMHLEKTFAHSFNLALGASSTVSYYSSNQQATPAFMPLGNDLNAWVFEFAHHDWQQQTAMMMSLYKTEDIIKKFNSTLSAIPVNIRRKYHKKNTPTIMPTIMNIGLCYTQPKVIFNTSYNFIKS